MSFIRKLNMVPLESLNHTLMNELFINTSGHAGIPPNILEIFLPGYGPISKALSHVVGFDITYLVAVGLIVFGAVGSIRYLSQVFLDTFARFFMSTITIHSEDVLYQYITNWPRLKDVSRACTNLVASTVVGSLNMDEAENSGDFQSEPGGYLNFKEWDLKQKPQYKAAAGTHSLWHKGKLFFVRQQSNDKIMEGFIVHQQISLTLTCFGRTTQPIEQLIEDCRVWYHRQRAVSTTVYRPSKRERWDRARWRTIAQRHSRSIDTVVLDRDQIKGLLDDVNEYLRPSTRRWYNKRGIPYRRGYLLYGPAGTGKTSLSFAIAGKFGLNIYCISLVEPSLTEEDLATLFSELPPRCVVLLEDIDSAGLRSHRAPSPVESKSPNPPALDSTIDLADNSPSKLQNREGAENKDKWQNCSKRHYALADPSGSNGCPGFSSLLEALSAKESKPPQRSDDPKGISLSGLLNTIDGVASQEGRVLIMTSNQPKALDPALVRPGRVDMQIGFSEATHAQIRQLFVRMYAPDAAEPRHADADSDTGPKTRIVRSTSSTALVEKETARGDNDEGGVTSGESEHLADLFAKALPANTLSPAEVQNFLLMHKGDPHRAAEEAATWWKKKDKAPKKIGE